MSNALYGMFQKSHARKSNTAQFRAVSSARNLSAIVTENAGRSKNILCSPEIIEPTPCPGFVTCARRKVTLFYILSSLPFFYILVKTRDYRYTIQVETTHVGHSHSRASHLALGLGQAILPDIPTHNLLDLQF